MKFNRNTRFERYFIEALSQSLTPQLMQRLVRGIIPNYDLHERSGFPENIPIPKGDAAKQIYMDVMSQNLLTHFIEILIDVDKNGVMGRPVSIRRLPEIIGELEEAGLYYDERYRAIIENEQRTKTVGWGVLREGFHYEFAFLLLDIVSNSKLVRKYSQAEIEKEYGEVKRMATNLVENREGRIWRWEGDGALAAFYFGNKNEQATLVGLELLLEMFMYNLLDCPFDEGLNIRLVLHTGPCQFFHKVGEVQNETLNRLSQMESNYSEPNSLTISPGVYTDLGTKMERFFHHVEISPRNFLYRYKLRWE
ncbi:MAG TPA: hypothetical protein VMX75_15175 [Spirochaetia bacterium]|nr:hypothetical protein [Spirochaetia bacterium]